MAEINKLFTINNFVYKKHIIFIVKLEHVKLRKNIEITAERDNLVKYLKADNRQKMGLKLI